MKIPKTSILIVNFLTLSRIIIAILITHFSRIEYLLLAAMWAGISDFADGYLARKLHCETEWGAKFDQYADKIASISFLISLLLLQKVTIFFILILLFREILITLFRKLKWAEGHSSILGKSKTFSLYTFFILSYIEIYFNFSYYPIDRFLIYTIISLSYLSFLNSIIKIKSFFI